VPGNDGAILILEATGPEADRLGAASRKRFGAQAATIGRAEDNDWVLPHPAVSAHHAAIEYADGVFYVTDTSTNGVFVNSRSNRLTRGQPFAITSGDSIIIEPFRIQASIVREGGAADLHGIPAPPARGAGAAPADPFRSEDPFAWSDAAAKAPPQGDEVDPLKLLGIDSGAPAVQRVPRAEDLQAASPLADHFGPPQPSPPAAAPRPQMLIPEDYDPAAQDRDAAPAGPAVAPAPQPKKAGPQPDVVGRRAKAFEPGERAAGATLAAVLAGAGLPDATVTPQLATHLGEILRVVVSGVMDVLRARQQIKDEFRMQATRFKQADNNALKFSANVNDALHNLLVKQNPAYLGPVEAFEDAFRDLRNHQIAMLAGMRVAFESMLTEFDPERLQKQFDRTVKKSILGAKPELQYWELYRQRAQDLARDVEATFRNLFGDRFVDAYEEQLDRLNEQGRGRKR
jgi:type VI secretion system FHA domain protein